MSGGGHTSTLGEHGEGAGGATDGRPKMDSDTSFHLSGGYHGPTGRRSVRTPDHVFVSDWRVIF